MLLLLLLPAANVVTTIVWCGMYGFTGSGSTGARYHKTCKISQQLITP